MAYSDDGHTWIVRDDDFDLRDHALEKRVDWCPCALEQRASRELLPLRPRGGLEFLDRNVGTGFVVELGEPVDDKRRGLVRRRDG